MSRYNKATHRSREQQASDNRAVSAARKQIAIDAKSNNQSIQQNYESRANRITGTSGSATVDASSRNALTKERLKTAALKGKISADKRKKK